MKTKHLHGTEIKNITLSISLLTSNRKDTIRKCLDSLTPLREQVSSELIIVDTGCDEEMLSIIEEYADHIVHFKWCDDFAQARNAGLEQASGEWFLFLDDDEWFEDVSEIVTFFQSGEYKNYTIAQYVVRNYGNLEGTLYEDSFLLRMAKLGENVRFRSCIHEALCVFEGQTKYLNDYVHHYGYVFTTPKEKFRHHERNETLLRKMIKEDRENLRWWLHLAQEYWVVQERYRLLDVCQEVLSMTKEWPYDKIGSRKGSFYVGRVLAAQRLYRYKDAVLYIKEALADQTNDQRCLAKLFALGAEIYYEMKDHAQCIECIRSYLVCYEKAGSDNDSTIFLDDAYSDITYAGVISLILSVAIAENDVDVLKGYFEWLGWQQDRLVVYDTGLFSSLVNFIADHSYDEYFVHMAQTFMDWAVYDRSFRDTIKNTLKKIESDGDFIRFGHIVKVFSQIRSGDEYILYLKIRAAGLGLDQDKEQLADIYWNLLQQTENMIRCISFYRSLSGHSLNFIYVIIRARHFRGKWNYYQRYVKRQFI